mmetsp:Transcript_20249/g.61679  ORF Transcript_20249/g.61679 Transcript_20249/m.61679 type:complete len:256 (-) Transcript_20249:173-940(-)
MDQRRGRDDATSPRLARARPNLYSTGCRRLGRFRRRRFCRSDPRAVGRRLLIKRRPAREEDESDDAEGPQVGRVVVALVPQDLRGDKAWRAARRDEAGRLKVGDVGGRGSLCKSKIANLGSVALIKHDVLELEISVHDAHLVKGSKARGDVSEQPACLFLGQCLAAESGDIVEECASAEQLKDQIDMSGRLESVKKSDQIWMVERGDRAQDLHLCLQPLVRERIRLTDDFDGDALAQPLLAQTEADFCEVPVAEP